MYLLNEVLVTVNNSYSLKFFSLKNANAFTTGCQWWKIMHKTEIYAIILTVVYSGW